LYGRTKAELERRLTEIPGTVIVRPGLVLGNGGIFGRIAAFSRISPLVPLPDGGHGRVPVIEINRLCDEIIRLVDHPSPPAENNIFHRHLPTLRDLVLKVAAESGRRPIILNIPVALALPFMRGMERMGLSLPVSADSLEGFVRNQSATHVTTLEV
jgi:NADH dehydrogenase